MAMRRQWRWRLAALGLMLALGAGSAWYLNSQAFQRQAERMILGRMGATAQSFHLRLWPLEVSLRGVHLPGIEVAQVEASIAWRSLVGGTVRLHTLTIVAPVVHVEGDGAELAKLGNGSRGELNVAIAHLDVHHGRLTFADRSLPWDVHLTEVEARAMRGRGGYTGTAAFASDVPVAAETVLRFGASRQGVRLERVVVKAAGATIVGEGWLRPIERPVLTMNFHLAGPAVPLAAALRRYVKLPERPQAGTVTADGQLTWSEAAWQASANAHAVGVQIRGLGPWTADARLSATRAGFYLENADVRGLGARITAAGASPGWRALAFDATVQDLPLAVVRRFVPTVPTGLDSLLSGDAQVTTDGPVMNARLTLTPQPGARLPVSGTMALELRLQGVNIQRAELNVGETSIQASGRLSAQLHLNVSVHGPEIAPLRPVLLPLAARLAPGAVVPDFGGAVELDAHLTGSEEQPTVAGTLAARHAHWGTETADALTLAGTVSRDAVNFSNFSYQAGRQRITAHGVVGLEDYRLAATNPLDVVAQIEGLSLDRVRAWTGLATGASGIVSAHAALRGTWGEPEGTGTVALAQINWRGQAARSVTASFTLKQGTVSSTNLALGLGRTKVHGSVQVGLTDHTFQAHLTSAGVHLSEIAWLQSQRLTLGGSVRFELTAQGQWDNPQADLVFSTTGLTGSGETLGDLAGRVHLAQGQAAFQAADILPNGSFHVTGTAATASPYPVSVTVNLRDYDFDAWLRRFTPAELTGHSLVSGMATVQGPLGEPAKITAKVNLDPVELAVGGLVVRNQGPIEITADQRGLVLNPAHLVALDTDFSAQGAARLGASLRDPAALTGQLQGAINLALVHSLYAPLRTSGQIKVTATLGGTTAAPQVRGEMQIVDASLVEQNSPIGFDGVEGLVRLEGRRLQIERLTAHTSGGSLAVAGFVSKLDHGYGFDLNATGQNLRLRYQGISATGNTQLRLSGQGESALLSGDAQLNRVGLDRNFDLAVFIASTQSNTGPPNPDSLLNKIRLNVHLVTGPQVEVATNLAHLQLQADIRLRGTLAEPSVLGRASASEGRVLFAGNEYQVTKAQVQFVNPFRIEPLLDVGLRTTVQQYDVTLNLSGPVDKLAITYRSDPPLSSSDVVALLATGAPTQATASLSAAGNYAPSEALLGEALNNLVAGRLQRLFGITQVQVNPNGGALGTTGSGGTVTIQQQVARNLKLTYTQNLASSAQDIVQVDWTISRLLGLTLSRDQFGLYGLKFTFRHRRR